MKTTLDRNVVLPRGFRQRLQNNKKQARRQAIKAELIQLLIIVLIINAFCLFALYTGAIN